MRTVPSEAQTSLLSPFSMTWYRAIMSSSTESLCVSATTTPSNHHPSASQQSTSSPTAKRSFRWFPSTAQLFCRVVRRAFTGIASCSRRKPRPSSMGNPLLEAGDFLQHFIDARTSMGSCAARRMRDPAREAPAVLEAYLRGHCKIHRVEVPGRGCRGGARAGEKVSGASRLGDSSSLSSCNRCLLISL